MLYMEASIVDAVIQSEAMNSLSTNALCAMLDRWIDGLMACGLKHNNRWLEGNTGVH
jgi:hypothetical protein